jgi:hypothetical protein
MEQSEPGKRKRFQNSYKPKHKQQNDGEHFKQIWEPKLDHFYKLLKDGVKNNVDDVN